MEKYNLTLPYKGEHYLTSPFGPRGYSYHYGVDFDTSEGEELYAIEDGYMIGMTDGFGGKYIQLEVEEGFWHYVHLESFEKDGFVKKGELIGYAGNTGDSSGPHTHIGYYSDEAFKFIDPLPIILSINEALKSKREEEVMETNAIAFKGRMVVTGVTKDTNQIARGSWDLSTSKWWEYSKDAKWLYAGNSECAPSLVIIGGYLYAHHRGMDNRFYSSWTTDGIHWSPWQL
jgi:hypothetical protein